MPLKRNNATDESRQFWENVDKTAARVDAWPGWMEGDASVKPAPLDKANLLELLDKALDAAYAEGMEYAADQEGCSWSGRALSTVSAEAEQAKQLLIKELRSW